MERAIKARIRTRKHQHMEIAWGVWHGGMLPNVKKYPELKEFIGTGEDGTKEPVRQKSPEHIRAIMTQWAFVKADVKPKPRTSARAGR